MVKETIRKRNLFTLYLFIIFFILIVNLIGNIPYSYTITTSVIVTIRIIFYYTYWCYNFSLYLHQFNFFSYFLPSGTPLALVPLLVVIETVSYLS